MHGGRRTGAGRPRGARRKITEQILRTAAIEGEMPLEFMLHNMRDEDLPVEFRAQLAIAAAPFCHSKLTSTSPETVLALKPGEQNIIMFDDFLSKRPTNDGSGG